MLRNVARICLVVAVVSSLAIAGCGSQQAKTANPPAKTSFGVIDMEQVVKAHPKYGEVQRLQKDHAALAARIEAERAQGLSSANLPGVGSAAGLEQAAAKEFEARMAAREAELRTRLDAAADQARRDAAAALDAYVADVDKEYQPQLFSLQLKLKTLQLSKEEGAAIQAEVERLQKERAAKIAARQKELDDKSAAVMKAKQAEAEQEMAAYARMLQSELASQVAGKQAEMANRLNAPAVPDGSAEKLAAAARDVAALQDFIIADIKDKAGKVAVEKGLDTVLSDVRINVSAVDITAAVIAEFKK